MKQQSFEVQACRNGGEREWCAAVPTGGYFRRRRSEARPQEEDAAIIDADGWSYKKWFRVKVHFWKKCIKSGVSNTSFCVRSSSSVKFQSGAFLHFWLFLCGLLMPSEGALWALLCWMAPSFPLKFAKNSIFIKENGPSKKIFPLRGQNAGEGPRTPPAGGVRDSARSASASYIHCF